MAGGPVERRGGLKLASLGFDLAAAVGGLALVGYWVDRHWETRPWGLLVGAMLGLTGGMYNLIKAALAASRADSQAMSPTDDKRGRPDT